jgi:N utilization substance protein B
MEGTTEDDVKLTEKFLLQSMNGMYDLYLGIMALFIAVYKRSVDELEKSQQKKLATEADKNPNLKFVNNEVLKSLSNNASLITAIEKKKLNLWDLDFEYVEIIYKSIKQSRLYKEYMAKNNSSFQEDKLFVIDLFSEVIAPNDKLYDYFEDQRLTWIDDFSVVNTFIVKSLKKYKQTKSENYFLPELYKDLDDLKFGKDLLRLTIANRESLRNEVAGRTKNWDADRLATLDGILLQMAICELQMFPSIPVKVTINEYLEIAKEYSTPKSSIFINGVLDKLVKEYKAENLYPKTGRGLL